MDAKVTDTPRRRMGRPPTIEDPRAHIFRVSARLFSENGFQGSSLAKLAAAMRMSKAFIYHYVSTKEQLIEEITLDTQQRLHQRTVARLGETASQAEKVRLFMVEYATFLDENFHEMRTANFSFAGHMSEEAAIRARQNNRDHLRLIVEVFEAGVAAGELVAADPWLSARAVFSLTHSLARWYRPGEGRPAVSYAEDFFAVIARGVLPRPETAGAAAAGDTGAGGAGDGGAGDGDAGDRDAGDSGAAVGGSVDGGSGEGDAGDGRTGDGSAGDGGAGDGGART